MVDNGVVHLGKRLREARERAGLSLRAVARTLDFSPSFVSQIENGKSQPSVATLYALATLLDVPIDELFKPTPVASDANGTPSQLPVAVTEAGAGRPQRIPEFPAADGRDAQGGNLAARFSIQRPGQGRKIVLDSGVVWTQLATNTSQELDFIEVLYPVGSSSTTDDRMLQHVGHEYGYLIEGQLEVTVGFDVYTLDAGDSLGLESAIPHLFKNTGDIPARGIWCVHHTHPQGAN